MPMIPLKLTIFYSFSGNDFKSKLPLKVKYLHNDYNFTIIRNSVVTEQRHRSLQNWAGLIDT